MAVINTGLVAKGLRSEFFNRFEATTTYYQDLATRVASTTDSETYRWLGTVPQVREWGDGRLAQGLRSESYSIENLKYEATLEVDRDEFSDDQTGQIRLRVGELAERAATHKDYLISQLLIDGETAGNNSYDGVSFFNASHQSGESGTQSNLLTYDVATPESPTVEEFKEGMMNTFFATNGTTDRIVAILVDTTGAPAAGLSASLRIQRQSDGQYLQSDDTWDASPSDDPTMTQTDSANMVSPAYVVLKPKKGIHSEFFFTWFKLYGSLQLLTEYSRGLTKDRLRLYFEDFASVPMIVPEEKEQKKIAACLTALDAQINAQATKLDTLQKHKRGLMQQLFPSPE